MADWYSVQDDAEVDRLTTPAAWPDAPIEDLDTLELILDTAREQVIAYAPAPGGDTLTVDDGYVTASPIPARYALAQLQQAKNLWNAGRVSSDGNLGDGGFTFTPRPLDRTIRQIIRPVDGKPDVY
ncbi:hypothetical protein [Microbacterium sp. GXF7504]